MWQLFIVTFFDWREIQFDQVLSSLIHFGQIWSKKIKNKTAIFILSGNVTTFHSNIFRLARKSNLIKFDQVWSSLIHFGRIWSKKIKNKTAIFILSVNVTTFYGDVVKLFFWVSFYYIFRKSKAFRFFIVAFLDRWENPIWSSLIKFDPFWTDLIQKNEKQKGHFHPFCKCGNFL